MEKVSFVIFLLLSTSDGHNRLNKVSVITESSLKETVDRLEFSPLPNWPDSPFYEEDGPDIKLRCSVSPKTKRFQMKWYRNNMELDSGQKYPFCLPANHRYVIENNNQTLTIIDPEVTDEGNYTCSAYHAAESVSYTGNIFIISRSTVTSPRIVLVNPRDGIIHAELGSTLNISCTIDPGDDSIDVVKNWQRDGGLINDSEHTTWGILLSDYTPEQLFYLTIHSLNVKDYGGYECYTGNELGNDTRKFQVLPPNQQSAERALPFWVYILIGTGGMAIIVVLATAIIIARRCRNQKKYQELEWQDPNMAEYAVPQHNVVYDVFVSYSSEDLEWVKSYLFRELTEQKYHVCIDFKDFVPGMPISENIIDAIYKSKRTIILMSKNFLCSMWGQFELQQAHNRAIARREDVLILIKLDDCKIPAKMMGRTFLDWTNLDVRPHFWQRLAEAVGKPGDFGTKQEESEKFEICDEQKEGQINQIIDILNETNEQSLNHEVDS